MLSSIIVWDLTTISCKCPTTNALDDDIPKYDIRRKGNRDPLFDAKIYLILTESSKELSWLCCTLYQVSQGASTWYSHSWSFPMVSQAAAIISRLARWLFESWHEACLQLSECM